MADTQLTPEPTDSSKVDPSKTLKNSVAKCKRKRRNLVDDWAISVDYLRGKPFDQESDSDRVYVNTDNTMARRKAAQIASQLPEARLLAKDQRALPVLGQFAKRLNSEIRKAGIGDAMFETAKDAINAAGFGVVLCGYEARTESRKVLNPDPKTFTPEQLSGAQAAAELPEDQAQELLQAYGISVAEAPYVTSSRLYGDRISPSDFLWPLEFERSNFDKAPWLGHTGRMCRAEAQGAFKLTPEELERLCGPRSGAEVNLRNDTGNHSTSEEDVVEYDEIFYWRAYYDATEKYYDCIWRIVFIAGIDRTPIHGPWEGQKLVDGSYIGSTKLPLRVLTLDYVSDDPIPPSDSAVARPQVNEHIRSRTQMVQQRERSLPLRWHDVNRMDPLSASNLTRGVWQNSIPVKGNGAAIMGEVARANYPAEDFEFDRIIKSDLQEAWGVDNNQLGMFSRGRRTKGEADIVQANFATQSGFQRARVAAFFCGIAEVFAGLLSLHASDLPAPPPPPDAPPLDVTQLSQAFDYWVLPDSTVLLDANQRADQLNDVLDRVGKSGFVNPEPLIAEIIQLKGVDPAEVMIKPDTHKEEPPNLSFRFSGIADILNPIGMGILIKAGQAPTPDELKAAIGLLNAAGVSTGILPPTAPDGSGAPPAVAPPVGPGAPPQLPPADARPDWTAMPRVSKRSDE